MVDVINRLAVDASSFVKWLFAVVQTIKEPILGKIMVLLWSIWKERNERLWNNVCRPPSVVVHHGIEFLMDWIQARGKPMVIVSGVEAVC